MKERILLGWAGIDARQGSSPGLLDRRGWHDGLVGEGKTDARDAYVIAETLRHRGDLTEVKVATSLVTELRLLLTHRTDLVGDRVRMVNRLRDVLSGFSLRWSGPSTTPTAAARWSC